MFLFRPDFANKLTALQFLAGRNDGGPVVSVAWADQIWPHGQHAIRYSVVVINRKPAKFQ